MSSGIQIFNTSGQTIYDTSFLSWMLIDETRIIMSNQSATLSYPELAGYNFEAKVVEASTYDFITEIGSGVYYALQHKIEYNYTAGYPVVTLTPYISSNIKGQSVSKPLQVFVFMR